MRYKWAQEHVTGILESVSMCSKQREFEVKKCNIDDKSFGATAPGRFHCFCNCYRTNYTYQTQKTRFLPDQSNGPRCLLVLSKAKRSGSDHPYYHTIFFSYVLDSITKSRMSILTPTGVPFTGISRLVWSWQPKWLQNVRQHMTQNELRTYLERYTRKGENLLQMGSH